jgi:hypothetical protein
MKKPVSRTIFDGRKWVVGLVMISIILLSFPEMSIAKTIAVIPFILGQKTDADVSAVDTSIKVFHYMETDLPADAGMIMTKILHKALEKKYRDMLPLDTVLPVYTAILNKHPDQTPREIAVQLGDALNADYVVTGNIWRFRRRVGNTLAVEQPASVAFKVHLINVAGKTRVWRGIADKTQQPLTENLLKAKDFIKQGGRWLTAEELAAIEIKTLLKEFPIKPDNY